MNDLTFSTKPKWVKGAKSTQVDFLPKATGALANPSGALGAMPFNTGGASVGLCSVASTLKFSSHFPEEYFLGSHKSEFIAALAATDCALNCYKAFVSLCESLPLTTLDRSLCLTVLEGLFSVNSNWFLMPTSSTGKYHGGNLSLQNTIGGIYQHCARLCVLANSVLNRYKEVIESLNLPSNFSIPSKLLTSCLLHDIGKMNLSQECIYSVPNHGEVGAEFIESLGYASENALLYCISNHMYGWKAINVFNHIVASGASVELVMLLMLCECDFFGSIT